MNRLLVLSLSFFLFISSAEAVTLYEYRTAPSYTGACVLPEINPVRNPISVDSGGIAYTVVNDYPDTTTWGLSVPATFFYDGLTIQAGSTDITVSIKSYVMTNQTNQQVSGRLKVGGTYYDFAAASGVTSPELITFSTATNPRTGVAWTVDDVSGKGANALQAFGVNLTYNPCPCNLYLYSVQLQVTHTLP
jgi:hypothetical protein